MPKILNGTINNNSFKQNDQTTAILSNDIQEIISHKPNWILRNGILLFLIIACLLIVVTSFVQYPDIINTPAILSSINAPKPVITNTNGKLIKLLVQEDEKVIAGQPLGYMESIANHEEVIYLSKAIDSIDPSSLQSTSSLSFGEGLGVRSLGELQSSYQTFSTLLLVFKEYLSNGFYLHKKSMLATDMKTLKKLNANLLEQKELNTQDLTLSEKTFSANESLNNDKVISDFDYRNEKSKFINKKLTLPQITNTIISNEALQNEKLKEIAELENTIAQQKSIFQQALNTFKSQIDDWKKKYVLVAPVDGKVSFATPLQENQQLQANQIICFINPENSQYYAQVIIPQYNFGKVAIGQNILLKFPSYPFQEYGTIKGKINFISHIPTDSGYWAKVVLSNGLKTNYQKQIQYREGLTAQGEIITQNMSLLQRFYYNIVKQIK